MSKVARDERLIKCLKIIDELDTPFGPLVMWPPFPDWDARIGKLSIKTPGTSENGAVYCHASMFKAFADFILKRGSIGYETIRKTLPTNTDNPPEKNKQVPIFLPNFYFGLKDSHNFGNSSMHNSTGTCAWMLWLAIEYLFGVKATVDGLIIDPNIPASWREFSLQRDFKKARYNIIFLNPDGVEHGVKKIIVNGMEILSTTLNYEDGKEYEVTVIMG